MYDAVVFFDEVIIPLLWLFFIFIFIPMYLLGGFKSWWKS